MPKERKYLETLTGTVSEDDWKRICDRAIEDAKSGDHKAREWLSKYLLPSSEQIAQLHLHQHVNGSEDASWMDNAPGEAVIEFLTAVRKLEKSCETK